MTLKEEIEKMQGYLETDFSGCSPEEYKERLQTLSVYMARSGALLSQAKMDLNYKVSEFYESHYEFIKRFSPSQAKEYMKARCYEEQYYVDILDRINATCVHQSNNIITLLSYAKQELILTKTGY